MNAMENKTIPFLPGYLICVDKWGRGGIRGRMYCGYEPFPDIQFQDIPELILRIEAIMDAAGRPHAAANSRGFRRKKENVVLDKTIAGGTGKAMREFTEESSRGQKATFILQVRFRQNASWQGTVQWVEKKQSMNFRSALELIKIIDSACEEGYEPELINTDVYTL